MTYDEAMVAAERELPVVLTLLDGGTYVNIEGKRIVQVGYNFINGRRSEFVQLLDKNGGCVYNARLEDVRLKSNGSEGSNEPERVKSDGTKSFAEKMDKYKTNTKHDGSVAREVFATMFSEKTRKDACIKSFSSESEKKDA